MAPTSQVAAPPDAKERRIHLGDSVDGTRRHSHPLSVLRDDDGHNERRRGDYFERREVDFLL